jgi:hypothetical protein
MEGYVEVMADGGTGQKLTYATTVVAGVASVVATILSVMYERFMVSIVLRIANNSPKPNNAASQKLSQASSAKIRCQNPPYGAYIFDSVMDQHGFPESCLVPRSDPRYI